MLRISPLLYVALSVCTSLFCSLYVFAVCVFALFFYICFSFLPSVLSFFFFSLRASLSTDQIMEQFLSIFSCTTPNFMFSRDPLFSLFLFSLFRYFLNSFFLVCDSPLSPTRVPHFLVMTSLYSLFSFSIILLLYLLLPVAIFNSLSLFFLFYFIFME